MDRMPWLKWWIGSATDPKMRMVAEECNLSVAAVIGVWAYLLEKASSSSERGFLPEDLDFDLMAYTLKMPPFDVETVCNAMKRVKLVTSDGQIVKWEERQGKREKSEPPGASTKRVQALRARQKEQQNKELGDKKTGNDDVTDETDETDGNDPKRPKKEKKNREDLKPKTPSSAGADGQDPFEVFWDAYPRKVGKLAAKKAWTKLKPGAQLAEEIIAAVVAQIDGHEFRKDGGQFIPHASTWLNAGRWTDVVVPYKAPPPKLPAGWWETPEGMKAAGLMLDPPLTPNKGEYPKEFAQRIRMALGQVDAPDNNQSMAPPVAGPVPLGPPPDEGDDLTRDERRERLALLKQTTGVKTAAELQKGDGTDG